MDFLLLAPLTSGFETLSSTEATDHPPDEVFPVGVFAAAADGVFTAEFLVLEDEPPIVDQFELLDLD